MRDILPLMFAVVWAQGVVLVEAIGDGALPVDRLFWAAKSRLFGMTKREFVKKTSSDEAPVRTEGNSSV